MCLIFYPDLCFQNVPERVHVHSHCERQPHRPPSETLAFCYDRTLHFGKLAFQNFWSQSLQFG